MTKRVNEDIMQKAFDLRDKIEALTAEDLTNCVHLCLAVDVTNLASEMRSILNARDKK